MRIKELVWMLQDQDPEAEVRVSVRWAGDVAWSDLGEELKVAAGEHGVTVSGWMTGCDTELEVEGHEDNGGSD